MTLKKLAILASVVLVAACSGRFGSGKDSMYDANGHAKPGTTAEFQQNVGDRVLFDTDHNDLSRHGRAIVERQAAWLKKYSRRNVVIEGHADERYTRAYNLALGARRAEAVKNYLVALGVDEGRVSTMSYGKDRPEDPSSSPEAYATNRRAVTVVIN